MARAGFGKMSEELSVTMRTLEGRWPAPAGDLSVVDPLIPFIPCPLCPLASRLWLSVAATAPGEPAPTSPRPLVIQGHPPSGECLSGSPRFYTWGGPGSRARSEHSVETRTEPIRLCHAAAASNPGHTPCPNPPPNALPPPKPA